MSDKPESTPTRRRMLVGIAATGAALAGAAAVPGAAEARLLAKRLAKRTDEKRFVFRLTVRGRRSCKACKEHHKFVLASHSALIHTARAHPGCNCPITRQVVHVSQFRKWFPAGEGVIDLRKA